jgi:hypothetical protein
LRRLHDRDETSDDATHVDACGDVLSDGGAIPPGSTNFLIVSRRLLLAGCLALTLGTSRDSTLADTSGASVILWAWERPEDLRFLSGSAVGVAFLDRTIVVHPARQSIAQIETMRRRQPLRLARGTPLVAVVRIESAGVIDPQVVPRLSSEILDAARVPGVSAIQIDFDAMLSQRALYSTLLRAVHARLPRDIRLSVTALSSWCSDDPWIDPRDVDEIVPMLFRMGPDARRVVTRLSEDGRWPVDACNGAIGLSTDERWRAVPGVERVYVFNPRSWRAGDLREAGRLLAD